MGQKQILEPKRQRAFTIIELLVTLTVIALLVTITVFGFSSWRERTAKTEVSSDAKNIASAMKNARNFNKAYPLSLPDNIKLSRNVNATYAYGDTDSYCVDLSSRVVPSVVMFVDESGVPRTGTCSD